MCFGCSTEYYNWLNVGARDVSNERGDGIRRGGARILRTRASANYRDFGGCRRDFLASARVDAVSGASGIIAY